LSGLIGLRPHPSKRTNPVSSPECRVFHALNSSGYWSRQTWLTFNLRRSNAFVFFALADVGLAAACYFNSVAQGLLAKSETSDAAKAD
jgi:hypothetical protein